MRKICILCIALISMIALTSCKSTSDGVKIEMQLNGNYDDTEPFVHEKLFYLSKDLETLTAKCELEMDGERGVLEVKDNKTDEVFWSNSWDGAVELTPFSVSLDNLKKMRNMWSVLQGQE